MKKFFGNVKQEFRKITWPTDKEMKASTIQVFVFMVVLSVFFAGIDAIISTGVNAATNDPAPIVEDGDYGWSTDDYSDFDELPGDDSDTDYDEEASDSEGDD